jgi:hypothetical protein
LRFKEEYLTQSDAAEIGGVHRDAGMVVDIPKLFGSSGCGINARM